MNEYRIVLLTPDGQIRSTVAVLCETDEEARREALSRAGDFPAEVWRLGQHVGSHRPAPSQPRSFLG